MNNNNSQNTIKPPNKISIFFSKYKFQLLGLLMVLVGIVFGLYVGIYLMLIGGIIQVITALQMAPIEASTIAWGIFKILFSGLSGWVCALVLIFPGAALLKNSPYHRVRSRRW